MGLKRLWMLISAVYSFSLILTPLTSMAQNMAQFIVGGMAPERAIE